MKVELQNKLVEKHPAFFEYLKDCNGVMMPMRFGFECGDGWYFIISNLMDTIQNYIDNQNNQTQIKSKFWRKFLKFNGTVDKIFSHFKWSRKLYFSFRSKMINRLESEKVEQMTIDLMQVKEKYGGLRFYIHGGDSAIDGMISLAEDMSYNTCEYCGTTENVGTTQGWISVCCATCHQRESNRKDLKWVKNE